MYTISDIMADISRGCVANNLNEGCFSYRLIYFINENGIGAKHYIDTAYEDLRKNLETIIRNNLSLTNTLVIAQTTVRKDGKCVSLLSRSYGFNLSEYFSQMAGKGRKRNKTYNRYATAIPI